MTEITSKLHFNRTKVVATIGPASSSEEVLKELILAGVDICRLNFSHGSHDLHLDTINTVRKINDDLGTHVTLLCDLQGPKIRLGEMQDGQAFWEIGDEVVFTTKKTIGTRERVYITYPQFPRDVKKGDKILIDDGKLELDVTGSNSEDEVHATVSIGGTVSSKKGVNLPNTYISLPSLTEKDLADLEFALKQNVDWVALSFVRSEEDIYDLRKRITEQGKSALIIAKIEKPEAVTNIDAIIEATDGVMIARGDLGVEMAMEDVPVIQKAVVRKCLAQSKPVIIATQMMESMITNPKPTRAEANDVANAVMDGADAVMLSGETSVGLYPVRVVEFMDRIIRKVESEKSIYNVDYNLNIHSDTFLSDAVCLNAVLMSKEVEAKAIISMTKSGYTAFKIASFRPEAKVFVFSDDRELLTKVNLIWGVRGFLYDKYGSTDETFHDVIELLKRQGYLETDDLVINTASMPIQAKARTNTLKITVVE